MAQTRIDSVIALTGFPAAVPNVPANWPTEPQPGKISLLWQYNYHELYHKFSPFTNFKADNFLGGILSDKQPFVYTFIDEVGQGLVDQLPAVAKSILSTVNVNQDTVNDVVRVAKFQISSWGVTFLGTQFLLQRLQPFDETRIYNPLSVLLSTVQPMTIGLLERPTRHVEPNISGLIGAAGLGNFIGRGYQTPTSTAGDPALSDFNSGQGKGLVRGSTATTALANFTSQWPAKQQATIGGGIVASLTAAVGQLFGGPGRQPAGTIYRGDETAYTTMALSKRTGGSIGLYQPWFANPNTIADPPAQATSLGSSTLSTINNITSGVNAIISILSNPTSLVGMGISALFPSSTGNHYVNYTRKRFLSSPQGFLPINVGSGVKGNSLKGRVTGYTVSNSDKYSNVIGVTQKGQFDKSDMLVQFSYYTDPSQKFASKFTDPTSQKVQDVADSMKSIINGINGSQIVQNLNFFNTNYVVKTSTYSKLLSSGDPKAIGYDNLFSAIPANPAPVNSFGVMGEYNTGAGDLPPTLDKRVNPGKNLRFATTFTSDGINQLGILSGNEKDEITIPDEAGLSVEYRNWKEYKPYNDDLIAFFFYDVVNGKYIPFRATVKGISEGNTAFWDELRFIGRADQLYSYNGFSRTLAFSFNVVVNSINELLPCWKRINYLASVTKPSNYTRSETLNDTFNRFIVPPMFMITIGDLYRYQPIVIRNVTINIPEDASWETLNQYNSKEWSYLNGIIKNPQLQGQDSSTGKYGQLPRECEISVEGALLEKERAQVGGSHFGHAPRKDNWEDTLDANGELTSDSFIVGTADVAYLPNPSFLHKTFIEPNPPAKPNTTRGTQVLSAPPNTPQPNFSNVT